MKAPAVSPAAAPAIAAPMPVKPDAIDASPLLVFCVIATNEPRLVRLGAMHLPRQLHILPAWTKGAYRTGKWSQSMRSSNEARGAVTGGKIADN